MNGQERAEAAVIEEAMEVARRAVRAAADAGLAHFKPGIEVETKADHSPVTIADRQAEAAMLEIIHAAFPDHAILGEETGGHAGDRTWRWILDPIDGTRGFTRGSPFWGPLVALEHGGRVVVGALALPVLEEHYWAGRGLGAYMDGTRLHLPRTATIAEAVVCLGEPKALAQPALASGTLSLMRDAASARCPGDLAGGAYVLTGRADVWIDAGLKVWDLAPFPVLFEEAGGVYTDIEGQATIETGSCIAGNKALHAEVLARFRGGAA